MNGPTEPDKVEGYEERIGAARTLLKQKLTNNLAAHLPR